MLIHEFMELLSICIKPKPTFDILYTTIIKAASKVDFSEKKSFRQYHYDANFGYFAWENLSEIDKSALKQCFIDLITSNETMSGSHAITLIKSKFGDIISSESTDEVKKTAEELVKIFDSVVKLEISIYKAEQEKKNNSSTHTKVVEAVAKTEERTELNPIASIQEEQTETIDTEATETDDCKATEEGPQPEPELRSKIYSCLRNS